MSVETKGKSPTIGLIRRLVERSQLPIGEFRGQWSGYVVTFSAGGHHYSADVDRGVRGTMPVNVIVADGGRIAIERSETHTNERETASTRRPFVS